MNIEKQEYCVFISMAKPHNIIQNWKENNRKYLYEILNT